MEKIELYHGSLRRFDAFSKDVQPRFDTGQNLLGHYLTDSPEQALAYARGRWGKVYVVEAVFENMKIVPSSPSGMCQIDRMQLDFNEQEFAAYRDDLIADGYDSICFESCDGYCEFVFLHDHQLSVKERLAADDFRGNVAATMAP